MNSYKIFAFLIIVFFGSSLYAQDSVSFQQQEINILKQKVDQLEGSIKSSEEYSSNLLDEKAKQHELQYEKLDDRLSNTIWAATIIGSAIIAIFGVLVAIFTFLGRNLLLEFIDKNLQSHTKQVTSEKINTLITEDWLQSEIEDKVKKPINKAVDQLKNDFQKKGNEIILAHKKTFKATLKNYEDELELRRTELEGLGIAESFTETTPLEKLRLKDYTDSLEEVKEESDYSDEDWFWKSKKEFENKNLHEALESIKRSIKLNPRISRYWESSGFYKSRLGMKLDAISDLNKAIELDQQNKSAWNNRGVVKNDLGKYHEAISDLKKAIEIDASDSTTWNNLGYVKNNFGKYLDAISDFDQAIKLNPESFIAFNNRGYAKNSMGNYIEAISDFDQAITLEPKSANSYAHRAVSYLYRGNLSQAKMDINKSIELDPNYGLAYFNLGTIKYHQGNLNEACKAWVKALELGFEEAQEKLDEFCPDK